MQAHIILREFYNNVACVRDVYSSRKRAEAEIEYIRSSASKEGWTLGEDYRHMDGQQVKCLSMIKDGKKESLTRYYIITQKIK
jgi:hypothetical protein